MGGTGGKIGLKWGKAQFSGLRGTISPIVPEPLEHPVYTFLMTKLPLLSQKLAIKLKKNCTFNQFHTGPSTFSLSLPKVMG